MTKQELEKLLGREVTSAEFETANAMYMDCGEEVDKRQFAADYARHADSIILQGVTRTLAIERDSFNAWRQQCNDSLAKRNKERDEMIQFLIEQAHALSSMELRAKAIEMLGPNGKARYITMCLEQEYDLWGIDKKDLLTVLVTK